MADKNFKVKSGLNIPITSAAILTTDSNGNISSTSVLPIANGGTGQTSANNALNALLPLQTSNANYFLQTNASNTQWSKVYYQTIQNNGVSVNPRGTLNIVGGTFADSAGSDQNADRPSVPESQHPEPSTPNAFASSQPAASVANHLLWHSQDSSRQARPVRDLKTPAIDASAPMHAYPLVQSAAAHQTRALSSEPLSAADQYGPESPAADY